jgi:hypothetical protein
MAPSSQSLEPPQYPGRFIKIRIAINNTVIDVNASNTVTSQYKADTVPTALAVSCVSLLK